MKTVARRVIALVLFGAVACTGFISAPAGASPLDQAAKFAGTYRVHVGNADGKFDKPFTVKFFVNGTGIDPSGDQVRWSLGGRRFHFSAFNLDETFIVVGDGITNANGVSSRKEPGTLTFILTGATSVWFAVKVGPAPGD